MKKLVCDGYRANEVFKLVREGTGLTQKKLAEMLGRTNTCIQFYEYGLRNFDFELLLEMCKKLDLSIIIEAKK